MQKIENDTWQDIEEAYRTALNMPLFPDKSFLRVTRGTIIDPKKSLRWNQAEVERIQAVYLEESQRVQTAREQAIEAVKNRAITKIAEETGLTEDRARLIWNFAYHQSSYVASSLFLTLSKCLEFVNALLDSLNIY